MSNGGQIRYSVGFDVNKAGLNELKASLQQLRQMSDQDLLKLNPAMAHTAKAEIDKIKTSIKQVDDAFSKAFNSNLGTLNVAKLNQELKKLNLQKIEKDFSHLGATGSTAFRNLATQAMTTNTQLKQSHTLLEKMGKTMANTMKWGLASSVMNSFSSGIRQAYGYVKNLDRSLNDIRIVTGLSAEEMDKFATKANKAAQALGQTTTNYTDAALIYYQQGLAGKEVEERAEVTLKAANVTGQSGAEVSEQLTAVWNGYKVSAEETELYIDKLAAVAASTASDLEELSTGMSKVASAANVAGVDIDQLNATLSTVISVTRQAPETVGTAFKTIYARMGDLAVDGVDEFGTTLGSVSSKMKTMGIEVVDESGNLRDMGTIVEEVAAKWDTWTEAQKQAAAVAMAGKRQYNNLIALFDNWEMYEDSLLTSANAAGTLQRQQDIYMESTQAHLKTLKSSAENLYDSILDSSAINAVADGLSTVANTAAGFVDAIGGGIPLLLTLGSIGSRVFSQQLAMGIATYINNLKIAREQTQHLQAEAQILQQFKGVNDTQIKTLVSMKEQVLALDKSITNEERNQANEMIKQHQTLMTESEELAKQVSLVEQLYQKITGAKINASTAGGRETTLEALKAEQSALKKSQADNALVQKSYLDFERMRAREVAGTNAPAKRDQTKEGKSYRENLEQQRGAVAELLAQDKLSLEQREKLTKAYDNFNKVTKNGRNIQLSNSKVLDASKDLMNTHREIIDATTKEVQESINVLQNHEAALKKNQAALTQSTQAYQNFIQQINFRAAIQQSIQLVGSFGQVAMAAQSIKGLGSIFSNESLSTGDKLLQIFATLGFTLPMIVSGLTGMSSAMKSLAIATGSAELLALTSSLQTYTALLKSGVSLQLLFKAALIATNGTEASAVVIKDILHALLRNNNDETKKAILLQALHNTVMREGAKGGLSFANVLKNVGNGLLKIVKTPLGKIAVIGALIAGAAILIHRAQTKEERATKKAALAAENLNKEYERTKQRVDDVKTSLEGYDGVVKTLKEMTQGTAEWNQKLIEANQHILDLINKYPELAQYTSVDSSGLMEISEAGQEWLNEQTLTELKQAQQNSLIGQNEYLTQKNSQIAHDATEGFYGKNATAIEWAINKGLRDGIGFLAQTEEQMIAAGYSAETAKIISENTDMISEAISEIQANNVAIESNSEQLTNLELLNDKNFTNLSEQDQDTVRRAYNHEFQEAYDKAEKEAPTSKREIREEYGELIGADASKKGTAKGTSQYLVNGEWTEDIANDTAKMAIATQDATTDLGDFSSTLYEAGKGVLYFKEQLLKDNPSGSPNLSEPGLSDATAGLLASYNKGDEIDLSGYTSAEIDALLTGLKENTIKLSEELAKNAGFMESQTGVDNLRSTVIAEIERQQSFQQQDAQSNAENLEVLLRHRFKGPDGISVKGDDLNANMLMEHLSPADLANYEAYAQLIDANTIKTKGWGEALEEVKEKHGELIEQKSFEESLSDEGEKLKEAYDIDAEAYEELAKMIYENASEMEGLTEEFEGNADAAKEAAKEITRYDKGLESLVENFEDWKAVLKKGVAADIANISSELREMYGNILDINGETLGTDFIADPENLDLAQKAMNGASDAYDELATRANNSILIKYGLDDTQFRNKVEELLQKHTELESLDDITVGTNLDNTAFYAALSDMLSNIGMSVEDAQALFEGLAFDATVTDGTKEVEETVAYDLEGHPGIVEQPYNPPVANGLFGGTGGSETATFATVDYKAKPVKKKKTVSGTGIEITNLGRSVGGNVKFKNARYGAGTGKSGSGGGGGGGGSTPKKSYKTSTVKKDRYREVNNSLKELGTELDRLAERQEKLFGKDLLNNLNKQLDVMKKQVEVTREKLAIAQAEAKEMRTQRLANQEPGIFNDLLDFGIKFDENGEITNYDAVVDKWDNEVKRLTDKWNSMSASAQEKDAEKENGISAQLERAEKNRDTLLQLIGDYDELLYDTIPGLVDEITQMAYDMITIQIEKFNIEVGLRMDMTEAIKDWREFEREIVKDLDTDQLVDWGKSLVQETQDVINTGVIETATSDLEKKMAFAQEVLSGDTSKISANNPYATFIDGVLQTDAAGNAIIDKTAMWEDIDKSREEIQENLEYLRDKENELEDAYYSSIDAIGEAVDKQAEAFERVNDTLNHTVSLLEMIKGEAIYADKAQVYDQMFANNLQALEAARKAELYYKSEYEKAVARGATKEEIEQWEGLWLDAQDNVRAAAEQTVEILTERFSNAVLKAIDDMDKALTDGRGLDSVQLEWEMNIEDDDRYLDGVNRAFALQDLNNKINQSINDTNSLSAQKRLNDLRDKELKKLREKEKLTQYDVDRANALYEIELKKIALEEAQNNKSQMRLRRDASGNYSYQFVADQDSITEAQNELMEAYNNLYNMDKEQRKEMEQNIMDLQNALKESMQEFSELSVEEQKARRGEYEQIWAHYNQQIADIAEEATVAQSNLIESTHDAIASTFRDMSETERQIMAEEMVPHFSEAVDTMIAKINGNNGLGDALNTAIGDIFDASQALADGIGMIESTLDLDSGSLSDVTSSYYADAAQGAKDYAAAQQENIDKAKEEKAIMLELWDTIKLVTQGYLDMASAATQAVQAAAELKTATYGSEADDIANERSTSPGTATTATENNVAEVGDTATLNVGGYTDSSDGKGAAHTDAVNTKVKIAKIEPGAANPYQIAKLDGGILGWVTLDQLTGYDTGGYTGSWNDRSGRLALLHQKELVLNERDTKNILTAVEAIRDISAPNSGSSIASILASISKWTESISNMLAGRSNALSQYSSSISEAIGASMLNMNTDNSGDNSTSIEIHADFPAATSTYEIEAAFNSLINNASQYTHSTRR